MAGRCFWVCYSCGSLEKMLHRPLRCLNVQEIYNSNCFLSPLTKSGVSWHQGRCLPDTCSMQTDAQWGCRVAGRSSFRRLHWSSQTAAPVGRADCNSKDFLSQMSELWVDAAANLRKVELQCRVTDTADEGSQTFRIESPKITIKWKKSITQQDFI